MQVKVGDLSFLGFVTVGGDVVGSGWMQLGGVSLVVVAVSDGLVLKLVVLQLLAYRWRLVLFVVASVMVSGQGCWWCSYCYYIHQLIHLYSTPH